LRVGPWRGELPRARTLRPWHLLRPRIARPSIIGCWTLGVGCWVLGAGSWRGELPRARSPRPWFLLRPRIARPSITRLVVRIGCWRFARTSMFGVGCSMFGVRWIGELPRARTLRPRHLLRPRIARPSIIRLVVGGWLLAFFSELRCSVLDVRCSVFAGGATRFSFPVSVYFSLKQTNHPRKPIRPTPHPTI